LRGVVVDADVCQRCLIYPKILRLTC
jgi:hypothetical protein